MFITQIIIILKVYKSLFQSIFLQISHFIFHSKLSHSINSIQQKFFNNLYVEQVNNSYDQRYNKEANKQVLQVTASLQENSTQLLPTIRSPNNFNLIGVLSSTDLASIRKHISPDSKPIQQADSQKLWALRIQTQRKKNDAERYEKFKIEELEKQEQDKLEVVYQQKLKDSQIRISNQQIFENQDDVRRIKSKLLFSEVEYQNQHLQEITKQIQSVRNQNVINIEREMIEQEEIQGQIEDQKKLRQQKKIVETRSFVGKQLQEVKDSYMKNQYNDKIEGQMIRYNAEQEARENHQKQQQRLMNSKLLLEDIQSYKSMSDGIKFQTKMEEDQANLDREAFITKKELVMDLRKKREKQKISEKILMRQNLFNKQVIVLKAKKNQQENLIESQIIAQEGKLALEESKKAEILTKMKQEQEDFRQKNITKQMEVRQEQIQENQKINEVRVKVNEILNGKETNQIEVHRQSCVDLQKYQKEQIVQKASQRRQQYFLELEEHRKIKDFNEGEKNKFNSWAEQCVGEWKDSGRNLLPLLTEWKKSQIQA